jgi:capsular polysaccharide transport system permease protein
MVPALVERRLFGMATIASLLAVIYWGIVASDRYVSEAHVVIQRTDLGASPTVSIGSMLGLATSPSHEDQLLLRDQLLSVDMLQKLDAKLDLRGHFSDRRRDLLSRMWFKDADLEWFHQHYLTRVLVEFDDYTGILKIKAQAYDPKMAHAIARALVEEGERYMNALGHRLAQEQVGFLEKQVAEMHRRVIQSRQAMVAFQNRYGMVSPQATVENYAAIVSRLESELSSLQARRAAMLGYLMPDSASVVELNLQIGAIEKQMRREKGRLAAPSGSTLNRTAEEFQRLQMNVEFAQDVYRTALVALESGRVEATRTLKKVSVLQSPFEPQYPIEPRRFYNPLVFILIALLIAGILQLLAAVIRDHKD